MARGWIFALDDHGTTPLNRAIRSNHMALTELLLRQDTLDRLPGIEGSTILHKAAYLGLHEAVKAILDEGAEADQVDKFGETPLHKAARQGSYDICEMLLNHGADANAVSHFGLTPLHWVALNGRADIADLLLWNGADPHLCDYNLDDLSPVELARVMGYEDTTYVLQGRHHIV